MCVRMPSARPSASSSATTGRTVPSHEPNASVAQAIWAPIGPKNPESPWALASAKFPFVGLPKPPLPLSRLRETTLPDASKKHRGVTATVPRRPPWQRAAGAVDLPTHGYGETMMP